MKKDKLDTPHTSIKHWDLYTTPHDAMTTEFEWAISRFQQAFERWVLQVANSCGLGDLNFSEVVILHVVLMQDRPKTAAMIARQLNRDDIPNLQYGLRKLVKLNLLKRSNASGKNQVYEATSKGRKLAEKYAEIRHTFLTEETKFIEGVDERMNDAVRLISMLTGQYDEAMRKAATYSISSEE
jgi:predicted MarR family transcription regulator